MRVSLRAIGIGLVAVGVLNCAPMKMKPFESQTGRFRILMPSEPNYAVRVVDPADNSSLHTYSATYAATNFLVAYIDFEANGRTTAEILSGGRASVLAPEGRVLLSERYVVVGGHSGLELVVEEGATLIHIRTFYINSRQYTLSVAGTDKKTVGARAPEFLESFAIL